MSCPAVAAFIKPLITLMALPSLLGPDSEKSLLTAAADPQPVDTINN